MFSCGISDVNKLLKIMTHTTIKRLTVASLFQNKDGGFREKVHIL